MKLDREAMASWLEALRNVELSELDVNDLGSWPAPVKALCGLLLFGLVLFLGYSLDLQPMQETLEQKTMEEETLRQQFSRKAFQASSLEAYREQMGEIETSFEVLLRQLPSDTEVPGLLEDITRTGLESGLTFEEIRLQPEVVQQYYVELPIRITVTGAYHDLATFASQVASLPRIVTLHDFEIKPLSQAFNAKLRMSILGKTYRYNEKGPKK